MAAADWQTETIAEMQVHLYVPSTPGPVGAGRALLIALHGCTQSPDALRDRGQLEGPSERHGAVIALPAVPNGGVIAGCWDYYGANHTVDSRHDRYLIALADALAADDALGIDPNQIYLIGLSSGGGEAAVMACLAPDRFAGIGINAGPPVGTSVTQASVVSTDRDTAVGVCRDLAGPRAAGFETQLTTVIAGSNDFVVAQGYAPLNAEIMAEIYRGGGAALTVAPLTVSPGGEGMIRSDALGPRVSELIVQGMGHAFPAGEGDGLETNFVAQKGVAWPEYVLGFFEANNRRLGGPFPQADGGVVADGSVPLDAGVPPDGSISQTPDSGALSPPVPDPGCSCRTVPAVEGVPFSLLLALLGLRRRKRG